MKIVRVIERGHLSRDSSVFNEQEGEMENSVTQFENRWNRLIVELFRVDEDEPRDDDEPESIGKDRP